MEQNKKEIRDSLDKVETLKKIDNAFNMSKPPKITYLKSGEDLDEDMV